ncbi:hypothetical protein K458DRAFT_416374 [Lentithecium fluviatile CBS 122367]|uniref:RBR-type E3 ubiquitin transferase n=1 Tax=Lentithecium fluviatile CBS 122367 TaxID=1168545 RepID=A0A6G1J721_9PLEO|nr:hypothetical protein K458DRAFT_416374 [Lentithecium fluviatile CBS 122367]
MGSRVSKAVRRPHVSAVASLPVPTASFPNDEQKTRPCQESQLPEINSELPRVNHTSAGVATSSPEHDNHLAPADNAVDMEIETPPRHSTDSRSANLLRELQELPGEVLDYKPPPDPTLACIICGDDFPVEDKCIVRKPCSRCTSPYCADCLKKAFLVACSDMTCMPPKCCAQIPIHHVRPFLTEEEVALFRAKYEEWSTQNPFYCPVARCSAFIPDRLLPQAKTKSKGKQRVDSGVGTPTSPVIACPSCETEICTNCRDLAHANATCDPLEFGVDKATAELLQAWGYKRCPKCGNGLKRMFGCNHMECRCGAHFCWVCLKNQETGCDGGCYEEEDDDYSDEEPDREEDELQAQSEAASDQEVPAPENPAVAQTTEGTDGVEVAQPAEGSTESPPAPRIRNLDGGSAGYWEMAGCDFGREPTEYVQDRAWDCRHDFTTARVSLAESLQKAPSATGMECMKCWAAIHPEIEMPRKIKTGSVRTVTSMASTRSLRGRGRGRGRARLHPHNRPYANRWDLGSSVPDITLHSQPLDGVHSNPFAQPPSANCERVVDTYGNTITTTEAILSPRRGSLDVSIMDEDLLEDLGPGWLKTQKSPVPVHKHTSISLTNPSNPFSFAYTCDECGILVCNTCKDALLAAIEDGDEKESDDGNGNGDEGIAEQTVSAS